VFTASLRLKGAGDLRGLSTQLGWDRGIVEPMFVRSDALADAQDALVLSAGPGNVDAAVLGSDSPGFVGDGVLATVTFRAKATGTPAIAIAKVDARDRSNHRVSLAGSQKPPFGMPLLTPFAPVSQNPFRRNASLGINLTSAGRADLAIYSADGRRVRTLATGSRAAGQYVITWDGTDDGGRPVRAGLFFARLVTSEGQYTRTLVKLGSN
jgi:hypothetical protein